MPFDDLGVVILVCSEGIGVDNTTHGISTLYVTSVAVWVDSDSELDTHKVSAVRVHLSSEV